MINDAVTTLLGRNFVSMVFAFNHFYLDALIDSKMLCGRLTEVQTAVINISPV